MSYLELKKKHENEVNTFKGLFFAFSNEQFEKGMKSMGLELNQASEVVPLGMGGYILKSKIDEYRSMIKRINAELETNLRDKEFLYKALLYELANHEYCITYDEQDALSVLGLSYKDIESIEGGLEALQKAKNDALACAF